jgi:hypothetical protein
VLKLLSLVLSPGTLVATELVWYCWRSIVLLRVFMSLCLGLFYFMFRTFSMSSKSSKCLVA